LPLALWLEADRMAGLWVAMNQSVLDNQRDVVKNERRQSYENRPYGVAELEVSQALWPEGHGNHNLTIGTMEDLSAASLADIEAFWRKYYRPSNATLVLAGGFDVDTTKQLIETYFGWMARSERPRTRVAEEPVTPREAPERLALVDNVQVPKLIIALRTDVATAKASTDLSLAAHILGGSNTSRLYRRLVMKERLATEVSAYHQPQMLGGEFQVHVVAREGVDAAQLRSAVAEEIARLRTSPVTASELDRARRVFQVSLLRSLENSATKADQLASWAAYHGKPNYLAEELRELESVTIDSIQKSAATWLSLQSAVEAIISPRAATQGGAQ
jgi:zinc protease